MGGSKALGAVADVRGDFGLPPPSPSASKNIIRMGEPRLPRNTHVHSPSSDRHATAGLMGVYATYAPLEMRRRRLARAKNQYKSHEHLFFPPAQNDDTLSLWTSLSYALNLGSQRIPSSDFRLRRPSARTCTVSMRLPIYRAGWDIFKTLWRRLACKPKSYQRPPAYCPFRPENYAYCPKKIFLCPTMDNVGQCANEKLTIAPPIAARSRIAIAPGYSGKMIRTNRGPKLESNARSPVSDKPCRATDRLCLRNSVSRPKIMKAHVLWQIPARQKRVRSSAQTKRETEGGTNAGR